MMKPQIILEPNKSLWPTIVERPEKEKTDLQSVVAQVFEDIKNQGDKALISYTKKFDGVSIEELSVSDQLFESATNEISDSLKKAIDMAYKNIYTFHKAQLLPKIEKETTEGVFCWQEMKAIEKVGLYIPGGSAPLFSTILMLAIPAQIMGCKEIVLCTPPNKEGEIHPAIRYAAQLVGVTKLFKVGGIQAIAALTHGTESIPQVYKIFGPGNQYVTAAKQYGLSQGVAIDMPAGPSELMVVADAKANPTYVAADLLSQAEHGPDSQVICVCLTEAKANEIQEEVNRQLQLLPRKELAAEALSHSKYVVLAKIEDQISFVNAYAPEHLILNLVDEGPFLEGVVNAGSVFIGAFTPESAGDYASGTNHTLPTNGYARMYSGVNLDAFAKKITYQKISEKGIKNIGGAIEIMADAEGLFAHKNAVTLRLNDLKK